MLNLGLVRIRWAFHACFIIILYFRKLRFLSWSIYLFRWEHVLLLQDIKNQKSRRKWSNKKKVWDNFCDIYKLVTAHKNCYQLGLWNVGWNFVTNWIWAKPMERLYMEAQVWLKTTALTLFLNLFFHFLPAAALCDDFSLVDSVET